MIVLAVNSRQAFAEKQPLELRVSAETSLTDRSIYKFGRHPLLAEQSQSPCLSGHLGSAANRLSQIIKHLPAKTCSIDVNVFPDQDGEGTFTIRVGLDGPDLYVLNKAIDEWADLFDVRHTSTGLEPPVPLVEPGAEGFEVNDGRRLRNGRSHSLLRLAGSMRRSLDYRCSSNQDPT